MTVYAPQIGLIWRTLEFYGIDPSEVIPEDLYRPGRASGGLEWLPLSVHEDLVTRAAALIDDPAMGLKAASYLHPSHLGALGYAWMASDSLREAILRTRRFHRMLNESTVFEVRDSEPFLEVTYRLPESAPVPDIQADSLLASLLQLCRFNFGPNLVPARVRMRRAPPAEPAPWTEFFCRAVQFGQAENSLALHRRDADRQLTVASPYLVAVHEEIMQRQLAHLDRSDVVSQARLAIMEQLSAGDLTEESIARRLHMSRRTLYNHLRHKGMTFSSLLRDMRQKIAYRYLRDPMFTVTEISFLLGYSDTSAFSRAFTSWTGVSPTKFRGAANRSGSEANRAE